MIVTNEESHTKFAKLSVGENEGAKSPQSFECLISVLLGGGLVDWCIWKLSVTNRDLLRLPDEILNQVVLIFREDQVFCLVNHVPKICNQNFPLV